MLAIFENLGFVELMVVLVVALLIFGRRLPEVAGQAGQMISKIKRSFEDMRQQTGIEREIQKARHDIQSVLPRNMSIGEMARMASAEMEKRLNANEDAQASAEASKAHAVGSPALLAAPVEASTSAEPLGAIPRANEPRHGPPTTQKPPGSLD